jgi:hypothetical protein
MKLYPKIYGVYDPEGPSPPWGEHCIAFDKLDGSNLRFEYSAKRGWYKFGTRHHLFDSSDPEFGRAIPLFLDKYGDGVAKVIRQNFPKAKSAIVYAEYRGPHTVGGKHCSIWLRDKKIISPESSNEPMDVTLFDVNIHKQGFLSPFRFLDLFSHLEIPRVIYDGKLTEQFAAEVRAGKYPVFEGVICKGGERHDLWFRKIKTLKYLQQIRELFGTGWSEHWE